MPDFRILQARAADPSGHGEVWQSRRAYDWNGAQVLLTGWIWPVGCI
ncbi:hypothetical protein ACIRU3_21520 [Streptomyces sp. NPDC101151]